MGFDTDASDGEFDEAAGPRAPRRRKPRKKRVTAALVELWATRHLERYASSRQNLRQVLARRVERIEFRQEERFEEAPEWIERALVRMSERGYLDDRRYAEALCRRLRSRGASSRRIAHELHQKGVDGTLAREVLEGDEPDADFEAAMRYARRRRIGPFRRDPATRSEQRERDLAALGRSGFAYEVARRVLEAPHPDQHEADESAANT